MGNTESSPEELAKTKGGFHEAMKFILEKLANKADLHRTYIGMIERACW